MASTLARVVQTGLAGIVFRGDRMHVVRSGLIGAAAIATAATAQSIPESPSLNFTGALASGASTLGTAGDSSWTAGGAAIEEPMRPALSQGADFISETAAALDLLGRVGWLQAFLILST